MLEDVLGRAGAVVGGTPGGEKNVLRTPHLDADAFFRHPAEAPVERPTGPGDIWHDGHIVDVPASALCPGVLWRLFREGLRAVRVIEEPLVDALWHDLIPPDPSVGETVHGERLPWAANLKWLANNHVVSPCVGDQLGDVFFARPNVLTYIARKMVLYAADDSGDLVVEPNTFEQESGPFRLPPATVQNTWTLGTRLLAALSPPGHVVPAPAFALERLMYEGDLEALARRMALVRAAGGPWSRLGHQLDEYWDTAHGPLRRHILRHLYAFGRLHPRLGPWLERLDRHLAAGRPEDRIAEDRALIAEAHTDHRLFTCLTSEREVLHTEFLTADGWRELPLTPDSLVIFPGELARKTLGLRPTRHRVLQQRGVASQGLNVTLLLGISPRRP